MIKNSDVFFERARQFQVKRAAVVDAYGKRIKALEDTKGSKYFSDETKKAEDTRDEALNALKEEYRQYFNTIIDAMRKANASRKMKAPTEEELRILQLLKMKDKPTQTELTTAANALKGNAACLSVLTEISHTAGYANGYMTYSDAKELSVDTVDKALTGLCEAVKDFLEYDTSRAARLERNYNEANYGKDPNAPELPKRRLFETKNDCFEIVGRIGGDTLTAFCDAVDTE